MGLGNIVDSPSGNSQDSWALISSDGNGNWIVQNTIVANLSFINSITSSYDYLVDYTVGGQSPSIGDLYTPSSDSFQAPPTDWVAVVRNDFDGLVSEIQGVLDDASNLDAADLQTAFNQATSDSQGSYTPNQAALMQAIFSYIAGGG